MISSYFFKPGSIVYLKDYKFDNGKSANKLLIIIYCDDNNAFVIHSLTTSVVKVPPNKLNHGCTNSTDYNLSYYLFLQGRQVGKNGYSFHENTFVHFNQNVRKVKMEFFNEYISSGKLNIHDCLTETEYKRLLNETANAAAPCSLKY